MQPRPSRSTLAACALPWLLVACGGSGSGDSSGADASPAPRPGGLPAADGAPARAPSADIVNGFVEVRRTDRDANGNLLLLATKTIDADANRLLVELERFGDGGYVASTTLDYDGAGNLVREAYASGDFASDTRYEHDADGVLRRARYDNVDGVADTTTFEYDAAGRLATRSKFDVDEDGPLLELSTYEYAADGLPESGLDVDYDPFAGTVVRTVRESYEHDARGRLETLRFDDNDDGSVDASLVYAWDEDGNMVRRDEFDAAGALVATEEYEYETAPEPIYNRWLRVFRYFL